MPDVVITRIRHSGQPRTSRTFEERMLVRFPSLYQRQARLLLRLSPHSRLRRALLRRAVVSGWAASSRRDFETVVVRYAPDVESEFDRRLADFGPGQTLRGREGMVEGIRVFREAWEEWEAVPTTLLDLGDRFLILGTLRLTATASGLHFDHEMAQLLTIRDGLVAREQIFLTPEEGLRAAGLDPAAFALSSPGKTRAASAR